LVKLIFNSTFCLGEGSEFKPGAVAGSGGYDGGETLASEANPESAGATGALEAMAQAKRRSLSGMKRQRVTQVLWPWAGLTYGERRHKDHVGFLRLSQFRRPTLNPGKSEHK
jgi:hypothetical protein